MDIKKGRSILELVGNMRKIKNEDAKQEALDYYRRQSEQKIRNEQERREATYYE